MKCIKSGSQHYRSEQKKVSKRKEQKNYLYLQYVQVFIRLSLKRYNHISMNNAAQDIFKPLFESQQDSAHWIPYAQHAKLLNTSSSSKKNSASIHFDPIEQLLEELNFWKSPYDPMQQNQKRIQGQFSEIYSRQQGDSRQNVQQTKKEVKQSVKIAESKPEEEAQQDKEQLNKRKKTINKCYQKISGYCLKKAKITKTNKNLPKLVVRLYFKYRSVSKKNCTINRLISKVNKNQLSVCQREELRTLKRGLKKQNFQNASLQYLTKLFHDSQYNSLNRQFFRDVLSQSEIIQKQIIYSSLIKKQSNRKEYLMGIKVMRLRMKSKQLACRIENC